MDKRANIWNVEESNAKVKINLQKNIDTNETHQHETDLMKTDECETKLNVEKKQILFEYCLLW